MAALLTKLIVRNDISTNWTANNPILLKGEIGIEWTTANVTVNNNNTANNTADDTVSSPVCKIKIGDGTTTWNNLQYYGGTFSVTGTGNTIVDASYSATTGVLTLTKGNRIVSVTASGALSASNSSQAVTITHSTSGANTSKGMTADVTIGTAGTTATVKVPYVTVDSYGHTTGLSEKTLTIHLPSREELGIATAYTYKGSCTWAELLAKTSAEVGDVWNITDADPTGHSGQNWACKSKVTAACTPSNYTTYWDPLAGTLDTSNFAKLDANNHFTGTNTIDGAIVGNLVVTGGAQFNNGLIGNLTGNADTSTTAGAAVTAGRALYAVSADRAIYAASAGYAGSAGSTPHASSAGYALTAAYAVTAAWSLDGRHASSAGYALTAGYAVTAGRATSALTADYAVTAAWALDGRHASSAGYANTSAYAVTAAWSLDGRHASCAGYAASAGSTTTAVVAQNAGREGYVAFPGGGTFRTTNTTATGALKITLPVSWSSTMMSFWVDAYNYVDGTSVSYFIGGYNYSGDSKWYNIFATSIASVDSDKKNLKVRFGHDGTKCCVYIGETTTAWSYPQVVVRDVNVGYQNYEFNRWYSGWSVSFSTTLPSTTWDVSNPWISNTAGYASKANTANYAGTAAYALNSDKLDGLHATDFVQQNGDATLNAIDANSAEIASVTLGNLNVTGYAGFANTISGKIQYAYSASYAASAGSAGSTNYASSAAWANYSGTANYALNADKLDGAHLADLYWANIKVQTASNASTHPSFGHITLNGSGASIYTKTASYNAAVFTLYDGGQYGSHMVIGGGGATILGSGEYAQNRYSAGISDEYLYVGSDNAIYLETNSGSAIANRKTFTFTTDGALHIPDTRGHSAGNGIVGLAVGSQSGNMVTYGRSGIQAHNGNAASELWFNYYGGNITLSNTAVNSTTTTIWNKLNYAAIANGTDSVARTVWFSDSTIPGSPVRNTKFQYNPGTDTLSVGNLALGSSLSAPSLSVTNLAADSAQLGNLTVTGSANFTNLINGSIVYANSAGYAATAGRATYASSANYATTASNAVTAAGAVTAGNASTAGSVSKSITFSNAGGSASGATYNGSAAITVSYNTVGAVKAVSSVDNALVRFDGTSGQVQTCTATMDDSGNLTLNGYLTLPTNKYYPNNAYSLNLQNSDIIGVNSIYTADLADNTSEGIHFKRTNSNWDSLTANDGTLYFMPNDSLSGSAFSSAKVVVHSGNYTSYQVDEKVKQGKSTVDGWRRVLLSSGYVTASYSMAITENVNDKVLYTDAVGVKPADGTLGATRMMSTAFDMAATMATKKATMQYNATDDCIEFVFA